MTLWPRLELDNNNAQGRHLVDLDVFAQPQCVLLDRLDVVLVIGCRCDIDCGSLGLKIGFGLRSGLVEGLGRGSDQFVDIGISEEVGNGTACQPLARGILQG